MTTMLRRAVVAAGLLMGFGAPSSVTAQQRALVYCPVGIDETGDHQTACGVDDGRRMVSRGNLRARPESSDRVAANRQRSIRQDGAMLVHGDDDAPEHEDIGRGAIGSRVIGSTH
jgi:hypothetical protein